MKKIGFFVEDKISSLLPLNREEIQTSFLVVCPALLNRNIDFIQINQKYMLDLGTPMGGYQQLLISRQHTLGYLESYQISS